jgi:hypothetical protein
MAEFTGSSVRDLPRTSAETLQRGDLRVHGWVLEAVQEGDRINKQDPSYENIGMAQRYVVGEQLSDDRRKLQYLPRVTVNESRKAMQAHVSTLTDIKPVFGWKSSNPAFQLQADLLNKLAVAEWVTQMHDLELGDTVKYALAGGTGDLCVDWDPHVEGGGANSLSARDARDTLPIRPSTSKSMQMWEGIVLREQHTVNALRGMYPTKANLFRASGDTVIGSVMGKFRSALSGLVTPADPSPLGSLGQMANTRRAHSGDLVLYRAHFRDRTRNLTSKSIVMGTPGTGWAYVVEPNAPLYPRGRLVVCTDDVIVYDGPNTYGHGLFPVCRLRLWSVPWQLLGIPLFNDLLPLQDAINDTVNDIRSGIQQWMDPDIVYNRNAVSEATMRTMDPRRPGKKVKVNPGFGEPWEKKDGPNPQVLALALEMWRELTTAFTDKAGTANLTALLRLRQMPSADTIEKYYEALTPEIRSEARQVEAFMRDLSEMVKCNYFQYLSSAKRVAILGDAGVTLEDFDYDPNTMVPALRSGEPGYTPELDADNTTRDQRARFFQKQFTFVVAPNSILAINSTERKMMAMQNFRMGILDFWSYHEALETPNVGAPPAIPLPPLQPIPPEVQAVLAQQMVANAQMGMVQAPLQDPTSGKAYTMDPATGQLLEIRSPTTIVERLQAQALLGIGMVANSAGRKASGQESPEMEQKSDGRTTVTESSK